MKHVFRGNEIAHAWVHRLAPYGRASNVSFTEDRYLSYATCIAERRTIDGKDIYFLSRASYTNSTAKHQSRLRLALPNGTRRFVVTGVSPGSDHLLPTTGLKKWATDEVRTMLALAGAAKLKAARARVSASFHLSEAIGWQRDAQELKKLFKLRVTVPDNLDDLEQQAAEAHKKDAKRRKAAAKALAKMNAERLKRWLAGDTDVSCPRSGDTRLRVREEVRTAGHRVIETSKGVYIPYDEARLALSWLLKHRNGWRRNGETFKIAGYNVDSVSESGVVAGCHHVRWGEIERIAKAEGWMK